MNEKASIQISRVSSYVGCIIKYGVFVDDKKIGNIANGKEELFYVEPGKHTIFVKVNWHPSESIKLDLVPNEIIKLECGNGPKITWKNLLIYFSSVFALFFLINTRFVPKIYLTAVSAALIMIAILMFEYNSKPGKIIYLKRQ